MNKLKINFNNYLSFRYCWQRIIIDLRLNIFVYGAEQY